MSNWISGGGSVISAGSVAGTAITEGSIDAADLSFTPVTTADVGTVTSTMILDGTIVTGDLSGTAGITSSQLAGSIAPSKITGTAITAADSGTVTSAMITDATIVTGDLSATAGITSGQLAGSIAPSKITGTAVTAADTGSVTSTMILDGTILNADVNASAAIAYSKLSLGTSIATTDLAANAVTTAKLASGIPQSLTASGSSTAAIADTSAHVVGGTPFWNGTGWIGLGLGGARHYYNNGANANIAETLNRESTNFVATGVLGATGLQTSYAIELYAGMVITSLSFRAGSTAGSAMTHWFLALYDTQATPALIAQTADQTSTAIAASTNFTIALGSPAPYTVTTTGTHYVSICVTATTIPTIQALNITAGFSTGVVSGQKTLAQTHGSAQGATAASTITSGTAITGFGYMATS